MFDFFNFKVLVNKFTKFFFVNLYYFAAKYTYYHYLFRLVPFDYFLVKFQRDMHFWFERKG